MIRSFRDHDTESVVALWRECGLLRPWNDPYRDIERSRWLGQDLFLVAQVDDAIVGSAMGGYDGHRGWVYYVAVSPRHRRQGLGRDLMTELERRLAELGCPKLNLQVRTDHDIAVAFYRRLGYHVDDVASLGRRLLPDT